MIQSPPSGSLLIFQYLNQEEQKHRHTEKELLRVGRILLCIRIGPGLPGSFSPGNPVVHRRPNVHREPGVSEGIYRS